jgi:hypothetical protein
MLLVAGPLRFRVSRSNWSRDRVRQQLLRPLDDRFGARMTDPWFACPGFEAVRLEMHNGDLALFCWKGGAQRASDSRAGNPRDSGEAYWLGNTETPEALWRTDKVTFAEAPSAVSRWAERELTARLETTDPWLTGYSYLTWFFLAVLCSKDGKESTREFFREHAAGFPDADRDDALSYLDDLLSTGLLDEHRYTMASKLGTSHGTDLTRMAATIGEFVAAGILHDAALRFEPEVELGSGHALDFRVDGQHLVEVTRPLPPTQRDRADTAVAAVKETGGNKTTGQLKAHPGTTLFIDCSSFRDDEWAAVRGEKPDVGYRPTVVYRARPDGSVEAYWHGTVPFDISTAVEWV